MSFTTHVIKSGSLTLTRGNSDQTLNLNNYSGFFYYMMGPGGSGIVPFNISETAGPSGFVNAGYVNIRYPYNIIQVKIALEGSIVKLSLSYDTDNPTGETIYPFELVANSGNIPVDGSLISGSNGIIPIGYYYGSSEQYTASSNYITQRSNFVLTSSGEVPAEGGVNSIFTQQGNNTYPGGGFYGQNFIGSGVTGPFGYSSGGAISSGGTIYSSGNPGYAVITLIPNTLANTNFYTTNQSNLPISEGLMICSLLAGGGGGGYSHNVSGDTNYGNGGGGSGSYQVGLVSVTTPTSLNLAIGAGGAGGADDGSGDTNGEPGGAGGDTTLTINGNTFYTYGGQGGLNGTDDDNPGDGGAGYFGGGGSLGGSDTDLAPGGYSYINMPSNISNIRVRGLYYPYYDIPATPDLEDSGNGMGYVNTKFGQGGNGTGSVSGAGSGGGGGPYGGIGLGGESDPVQEPTDGQGYGCGGGGGGHEGIDYNGGSGSGGYAILSLLSVNSNYKLLTVNVSNPSISLGIPDFINFKGFWFFLQGDTYLPELNMGHFLIQEDGVNSVTLNWNVLTAGTITVTFNPLNLNGNIYSQTFSLTAAKGYSISAPGIPQFANILFYK